MTKLLLNFIIITLSVPSLAAVNMRNGSYSESFIDIIDPDSGIEMKIERYYSSRSVYTGIFGFGWCSYLETYLTITSDGIINLTECGGGLEVTYYPKDFDLKSPKDTIQRIVENQKAKKKISGNDVKNFKIQLKNNPKMRFQYANELGLVNIQKIRTKDNVFTSKSKGVENITFNGKIYERKKYDGRIERFDLKGKLIQVVNKAGKWIKIHYKGKKIAYLVDAKGRRLNFSYAPSGKLKRIFNGRNLQATYKFQGENLVSVTNMWKKTYIFDYDVNHNLVRVDFPDSSFIKMTYNMEKDWIKTYTNRRDCVETFGFHLSKDDPHNHYWGSHISQCPNKPKGLGRHEFWYKNYSFSQNKYLHRVKEVYGIEFKDAYFHPYLGRVTSVQENQSFKGFAYFLNGLKNKMEFKLYAPNRDILKWNKMHFIYHLPDVKIKEMSQTNLNGLGKVVSRARLKYEHGRNGLLSKAYNDKGDFLKIKYDENAKISQLKSKTAEIHLAYKIGVNKPSEIEQKGVGKVTITYDPQGEIESIEANNKRNISSSSVIETFLKMIEFLGPEGENLKI